jgi:DNA-binding transcriptional LysR family regulator
LNIVTDIYNETRAQSHGISGQLQIAAIPSICNTYLSDVLSAFKKDYPQVRIEVKEAGTNRIMEDVIANKVDIGLISCPADEVMEANLDFSQLLIGTYVVYVGRNSTIPIQDPLPKELISSQPLITLQSEYRQEDYLKKLLGTDTLNILLTLGYTEAAKRIISQGIAVGFYPDFSVRKDPYVKSGDIIPLAIEDNSLTLRFGWIKARNRQLAPAAQSFVKVLKDVIDAGRP